MPERDLPKPTKEDVTFELQLMQVLENQNPWEILTQLADFAVPDRMRAYDVLIPMIAAKPQAEQDALTAEIRKVLKVAADTVRKDVRAYMESTRGPGGGAAVLSPCVVGEGWLAEEVYDPDAEAPQRFKYALWNGVKVEYVDHVELLGITYAPVPSKLVEIGAILMPSKATRFTDEHQLYLAVRHFINSYVDIPRPFLSLAAYYVMLSWVYDQFTVTPYLRVIGDYGSGKTRFIHTAGIVSYRPIFAGGSTTVSPLFRLLDRYKGTMIVDEADFSQSDQSSEMIKILNTGYSVGFPVLRSERSGESGFEPTAYYTFGPKILATRAEFKDKALESRMFTYVMNGSTMRTDIPLILTKSFWKEATVLRNQLLMWRFLNMKKVTLDPYERIPGIEPRLNQIILPMKAVMKNPKAHKVFEELIAEYQTTMKEDRGLTTEAMVARAVLDLRMLRRPLWLHSVKEKG